MGTAGQTDLLQVQPIRMAVRWHRLPGPGAITKPGLSGGRGLRAALADGTCRS
jgi:hypothetical protein